MNEWQIFLVIVEVIGLLLLVGGPILKLNATLTKLGVQMETQTNQFEQTAKENEKIHDKIENRLDGHDETLADHETRLQLIEVSKHETV